MAIKAILLLLIGAALGTVVARSLVSPGGLTVKRIVVTVAAAFSVFALSIVLLTTKEWSETSIISGLIIWLSLTALVSLASAIIYSMLKKMRE